MEGERKSYRYLVSGRVQGVGFRYFVLREAQALGLVGFVRNLRDGRVEVVAAGPDSKLAKLEALLWRGPMMADVKMVEVEPTDPPEVEDFSIARTARF